MPFSPPSLHGVKTHKPLYRSPERAEGTSLEETWVVKYPVVPGIFLRMFRRVLPPTLLVTSLLKRLLREPGDFRGKSLGQQPGVLI